MRKTNMTPPQKTKVPTDEEILEDVIECRKFYGQNLASLSSADEIPIYYAAGLALEAMAQARAAGRAEGREEQREKQKPITWAAQRMLETIRCVGVDENNDVCGVTYTCPNCRIIKELEEAIREQGEEK